MVRPRINECITGQPIASVYDLELKHRSARNVSLRECRVRCARKRRVWDCMPHASPIYNRSADGDCGTRKTIGFGSPFFFASFSASFISAANATTRCWERDTATHAPGGIPERSFPKSLTAGAMDCSLSIYIIAPSASVVASKPANGGRVRGGKREGRSVDPASAAQNHPQHFACFR